MRFYHKIHAKNLAFFNILPVHKIPVSGPLKALSVLKGEKNEKIKHTVTICYAFRFWLAQGMRKPAVFFTKKVKIRTFCICKSCIFALPKIGLLSKKKQVKTKEKN